MLPPRRPGSTKKHQHEKTSGMEGAQKKGIPHGVRELAPALGNAERKEKRRQAAALQKRVGQGKTRRMEGEEGMWPAGQLVVGSVLRSQFW